jgi:putative peptidoglycan lipid II flippase
MGPLAQVGLALATSIGAWINLCLVFWFARRAGHLHVDAQLRRSALKFASAGLVLAAVLLALRAPVTHWVEGLHDFGVIVALAVLALVGGAVYGGMMVVMFGRQALTLLRGKLRR